MGAIGQHGETHGAVCPRTAESLSPTVVDGGVRADEGRRVVVVNERNARWMSEGRGHDQRSTVGFRRGGSGGRVKKRWWRVLLSVGKDKRMRG